MDGANYASDLSTPAERLEPSHTHNEILVDASAIACSPRPWSRQPRTRMIRGCARHVLVLVNLKDSTNVANAKKVLSWLYSTSAPTDTTVYIPEGLLQCESFGDHHGWVPDQVHIPSIKSDSSIHVDWPHPIDLVVVLGGDGSLLAAAQLFSGEVPPILTFRLGSLNYMANFDFGDMATVLKWAMGDQD
ncbi:hypothetical protein SCP_1400290 [Sparassis crispa]|uniref:ATP-NAD kinase n=1 Tax=Sparassis crispa TaxID=139825 RepID=A0A401H2H7_9APHY|nr:hypothetical protein SCP_1400290 [Sparassis crispa]GBE88624.1 hypothetical protein SCP_1400290 [Sparassis crispa]